MRHDAAVLDLLERPADTVDAAGRTLLCAGGEHRAQEARRDGGVGHSSHDKPPLAQAVS